MNINPRIEQITDRIRQRSADTRADYLKKIAAAAKHGPNRSGISCSNLAHGIAACGAQQKSLLTDNVVPNIGIVTAFNEMLSAHQPYESYPALIRQAAEQAGAVAQVAGGVPAMCDGVTQGQDGMDLSLFSRDVIAMSTAIALSHNMFDAVLCLGICDKIVPGLLMGALSFGHLPTVFVPAGPMTSGLSNKDKAQVREAYASGEVGTGELIAAESAAYHSPGTCTFYGTANSNQMLMEFMGLQLPGGSFVNPGTTLRDALTAAAVRQSLTLTRLGDNYTPVGQLVDEAVIVNGIIGLLATGGSTNHTMHLVAMARAAGIQIDWSDFSDLSAVIPLLAHVYPNGMADVNHFHEAGGLGFLIGQLLEAGLLHRDVNTILGRGLDRFTVVPKLADKQLEWPIEWQAAATEPGDCTIVRKADDPFQAEGGLQLVQGNIGRAIVKVSAVATEHRTVQAPARVFNSQAAFVDAFENGELDSDLVAVVPLQGPRASGMPELHKLTPYLGVLQNRGYQVALLTDGRMSGASGKVLAAIQVTPEAACGGLIARIRDGDMIRIDADLGILEVDAELTSRADTPPDLGANQQGMGRELFGAFRSNTSSAEAGASIF